MGGLKPPATVAAVATRPSRGHLVASWWFQMIILLSTLLEEIFYFVEHMFQMGGQKPPARFATCPFFSFSFETSALGGLKK